MECHLLVRRSFPQFRGRPAGYPCVRSCKAGPRRLSTFNWLLLSVFAVVGCSHHQVYSSPPEPCSEQWVEFVGSRLATGDGQEHGPDPGSVEWRSVVEFRLGARDDPGVPDRTSDEWCDYIDELVFQSSTEQRQSDTGA